MKTSLRIALLSTVLINRLFYTLATGIQATTHVFLIQALAYIHGNTILCVMFFIRYVIS